MSAPSAERPRGARGGPSFDRPEPEWIVRASRAVHDAANVERLRELSAGGVNGDRLLATARRHGVEPLVHLTVREHLMGAVPAALADELQRRFDANARRNVALARELVRLLEHLERAGVEAVPFKGPVLAVDAYGNLLARTFFDLDVVVRERDVRAAFNALTSAGYRHREPAARERPAAWMRRSHEAGFLGRDGRVQVELHWRFAPPQWPLALGPDALWSRLERTRLVGRDVRTFSTRDTALVLAAHGARHHWTRLDWIVSLGEHLRSHPDLDGERCRREAARAGIRRAFDLGTLLARDLVGVPLPAGSPERFDAATVALSRRVREVLFTEGSWPRGAWQRFSIAQRERLRDRARLALTHGLRLLDAGRGESGD